MSEVIVDRVVLTFIGEGEVGDLAEVAADPIGILGLKSNNISFPCTSHSEGQSPLIDECAVRNVDFARSQSGDIDGAINFGGSCEGVGGSENTGGIVILR